MSTVVNGQAVLNWGTKDETWGYAEAVEVEQVGNKTPVQRGDGDTTGTIHSDLQKKVTGNYEVLAGAIATDPPEDNALVGKTITIKTKGTETIDVIVDSSKVAYKRGAITAWSFEGYYYPNLVTE